MFLIFVFCSSCTGQNKPDPKGENISSETKNVSTPHGPKTIVRTIKQDRKGNIWIASWDGVFRYDGKSFTNITREVSSARFFSILEDKKGNFWFSSVGSGVYYYDGTSFLNFTTTNGLASNTVSDIYVDSKDNIWFSTASGASRYDGQFFQNFTTTDSPLNNDVNAIIEDNTGKFWFGTRGNLYNFDGTSFTIVTHEGRPFKNVRSIIEDKNGNIWLAGNDGLWSYNGNTFTNFTKKFVGFVYEDKIGNIWTSTNSANTKKLVNDLPSNNNESLWTISRYNKNSLHNNEALPEIIKTNEAMIFGIMEANDHGIWFGTLNGVYRYDGNTFTEF